MIKSNREDKTEEARSKETEKYQLNKLEREKEVKIAMKKKKRDREEEQFRKLERESKK